LAVILSGQAAIAAEEKMEIIKTRTDNENRVYSEGFLEMLNEGKKEKFREGAPLR